MLTDEEREDEELWLGPMPSEAEIARAEAHNDARLANRKAVFQLLGPGMTDEAKDAWLMTPNPFLGGRVPHDVMNEGLNEVFDAIDQYQQGDFA
jgi:uncharacterized protein (DUF2384 family)